MKVSIATLISVYRGDLPALVASAIDSFLAQEFTQDVDSRIYLAIDGPIPLNVRKVIDDRISKIHLIVEVEKNSGLASALNNLIAKLKDEDFIFRMDADDVSMPNRYQSQLNYFCSNKNVDIVGTDILEINEITGLNRRVSFARSHTDALAKLCWRVPVAHPTVCFRRHVLQQVSGYPITGTNEDVALWFVCAKHGFRFGNVNEPLLNFRISEEFWRRRSFRKAFSEFVCYVTGIWSLYGLTWKYIFPVLRFLMRVSPKFVSQLAYASKALRSSG